MNSNIVLQNILRFLLLMLLQVLVLNHVYLGGYITPFLYVLFILMLPTGMNKMWLLVLGFLTGFCADVFTNMLGFHTAVCTFVAFCRILFGDTMLTGGEDVVIDTPNFRNVGFQPIAVYLFIMLFVYHLLYFNLLIFSFRDLGRIFLCSFLSTVVTWILALIYQSFMPHSKETVRTKNYR
jgi:hypothetical protein